MFLAASATSQGEAKSLTSGDPFFAILTLCLLDCFVLVPLSTCTSLTSNLLEWMLFGSTAVGIDGGEVENDDLPLGDERVLPTGLIWVATSRRETT